MRRLLVVSLLIASLAPLGCNKKKSDPSGSSSTGITEEKGAASKPSKFSGDEAGAKELLAQFVKPGADYAALSKDLKPSKADYAAVFEADAAAKAEPYYEKQWATMQGGIAPKEGQTEVKLSAATVEELKAGGGAADAFPGGYKKAAPSLKPGRTFYAFKFVKPGESLGMAFDGLTYVNGRWVIFFKPWRAVGAE
jgi:hypothetical protein